MERERDYPRESGAGAVNGGASRPAVDAPIPPAATNGGYGGQPPGDQPRRVDPIAAARFGMALVIVVEAMTFAGLISAFLSIRTSLEFWPPLDQPRFPVIATAINTVILLASGGTMFAFRRLYRKPDTGAPALTALLVTTLALGCLFVGLQGVEWARLIGYGLTVQSGSYGAIFYIIIGFHAIHVLTAVLCLALVTVNALKRGFPRPSGGMEAASIFWLFVVLVWPVLYAVVYF